MGTRENGKHYSVAVGALGVWSWGHAHMGGLTVKRWVSWGHRHGDMRKWESLQCSGGRPGDMVMGTCGKVHRCGVSMRRSEWRPWGMGAMERLVPEYGLFRCAVLICAAVP